MRTKMAAMSKRLFFIKWERPAPLEAFLLPRICCSTNCNLNHALNWTIPSWLDKKLNYSDAVHFHGTDQSNKKMAVRKAKTSKAPLFTVLDNSGDHGAAFYNEARHNLNEPSFQQIYRPLWDALFTPAPAVADLIDRYSRDMLPRPYIGLHIRSMFEGDESDNREMIENSVNCAVQLVESSLVLGNSTSSARNELPVVYLATDSIRTTNLALEFGLSQNVSMRVVPMKQSPMHLDRGRDYLQLSNTWQVEDLEDFYPTFVDLYLLRNSQCVTFGIGGFGLWGSLLSHNSSCFIRHSETKCKKRAAIDASVYKEITAT